MSPAGRANGLRKLGWFVLIYLLATGAFALAVYGFRAVMKAMT